VRTVDFLRSGDPSDDGAERNGSIGNGVAVIGEEHGDFDTLADARVKSFVVHDPRGRRIRGFHCAVGFTNR
jgi:hypothetical protein